VLDESGPMRLRVIESTPWIDARTTEASSSGSNLICIILRTINSNR